MFPVSQEAPVGTKTITYQTYDQAGMAKLITGYAKDLPRADVGGANNVRGYSTGRFRDKDMIVLNLEYRYPLWDAKRDLNGGVDAVIFWDVGRVFNDLATDTFKGYKNSYGGGIRARTLDGFLFRAEVSHSDEETNIIFKFEPMF